MAYISLEHVVKRYKMGEVVITAVSDISFEIEKGEFAIIVGPSGAGKTTVLNILGGMDETTRAPSWWTAHRWTDTPPGSSPPTAGTTSALSSSSIIWCKIDGPGECGAGGADLPRAAGRRRRCATWLGRADEQLSRPALRRRAAAGGHCPGAGQEP